MILVIHILVAIAGLACSTAALIAPSRFKIIMTYGSIALTLISGTILVIRTHAPILHSCITGLTYSGIVLAVAMAARRKLARQSGPSEQ